MSRYLSKLPKSHEISTSVNMLQAKQETRDVALIPNAIETVILDDRISEKSLISLMPVSAAAAAENPYFTVVKGQVTIHHLNSVAERNFKMGIVG